MGLEVERKFLVDGDFKSQACNCERIVQGYLSSVPERTVRVRIKGDKAYLTIKGKNDDSGLIRYEWEKEIDVRDADELIKLCEPGLIEKDRYYVRCGNHTFEVDEFGGVNQGLVVAEVELTAADDVFDRPQWLGREVTGDKRYYNSYLSKHRLNDDADF